jgi:mannose-1-phosphate guanylyltransferase
VDEMTAAIVLSAGLGTRLGALTKELAKPLMPVGDRPALAHIVEALARGGIGRVAVNTHHRASDFTALAGAYAGALELLHEPTILGTAGGVANAAAVLGRDRAVVWNGDILAPALDVAALLEAHEASRAACDALWVVAPAPLGAGTVGLDTRGYVVRLRGETFGEEQRGGEFLGIQVMNPALTAALPREGCLVGDVALPLLRRGGRIATFGFSGEWDDIGSPATLLRANLRWLERRGVTAWTAPGARVAAETALERCLVGEGGEVTGAGPARECVVFPGAHLSAPATRRLVAKSAAIDVP